MVVFLALNQVPAVKAGIKAVEDEVIFTLRAPGARSVYLVGDFNSWNPTIELMTKKDDVFTTSVFLVAGEYHYKFVVDGEWIADPDNPPKQAKEASLLLLTERGGELAIRSTAVAQRADLASLRPHVRFVGKAVSEKEQENAEQEVDFRFDIDNKIVKSKAILKTKDNTWKLSPLDAKVVLDRGHLRLKAAGGYITGFENDSTWASPDPFHLYGDVGVFGYSFGFGRRGITLEEKISHVQLKAVYSDRAGLNTAPPLRIGSEALLGFTSSNDSDLTLYSIIPGLKDEDTFGGYVFLEAGGFKLGYGRRENRGMNPGLLARTEREDSLFRVETFNTREYWKAYTLWFQVRLYKSLSALVGMGRSRADVKRLSRDISLQQLPLDVISGNGSVISGEKTSFQKSRRLRNSLLFDWSPLFLAASYEHDSFEYLAPIYDPAEARIDIASIDLHLERDLWRLHASINYTDQRYGDTPTNFHFFSQSQNFWLDYENKFSVENMIGFDMAQFSSFALSLDWHKNDIYDLETPRVSGESSFKVETGAVASKFMETLQYSFLRLAYERLLRSWLYVQVDARAAAYPQAHWSDKQNFISSYLEFGYRSRRMELSLGFGFDPIIFDRTRNGYFDIGRQEYLRTAVRGELLRGEHPAVQGGDDLSSVSTVEYNVLDLERSLQENSTLKLEWIVLF